MAENAYIYMLYDAEGRVVYVGIGDRQRPYEVHNDEYEAALAHSKDVRITPTPFSTVADAKLAESLLIRALTDAARHGVAPVNRSEAVSSKNLIPLVPQQNGTLRFSDLRNALIVKVSPKKIDADREVVSGITTDEDAAERCRQWWPIGSAVERGDDVRVLVAVTTAEVKPVRVLGIWETKHTSEWDVPGQAVELVSPKTGDLGGHRGKAFDWEGYNPQSVGFSADVRDSWS